MPSDAHAGHGKVLHLYMIDEGLIAILCLNKETRNAASSPFVVPTNCLL